MVRLIRASYIDFKNASSAVGPWRLLGSQRKSQLPGLGLQRVYQRGAVVLQGIQHGTHLSLGSAHGGGILNNRLVEAAGRALTAVLASATSWRRRASRAGLRTTTRAPKPAPVPAEP